MNTSNEKTTLQQKLEARRPHEKAIPLKGFPGIEGEGVVLRVLRKHEQHNARIQAIARVDKLAEKVPALKEDAAFAREQQTIALLFAAVRDSKGELPAFLSPEWMEKNFTTAEFDYLLNAYNQFVGEVYPGGSEHLDPEKLAALLDMLAEHAHTNTPDEVLALFVREILAEMIIRAAVLRRDALNEAEETRARLDALVSAGFVPGDEEGPASEGETLSVFAARLVAADHQNHLLANAAGKIRTARDAELAMTLLGWKEGSQAWRRVLGEESDGRTS